MFRDLRKIWNVYGFEIAVVASIVFVLVMALFRIGKKGTYAKRAIYIPFLGKGRGLSTRPVKKDGVNRYGPNGKESKGEAECRRVLQKIFRRSFNKARPDFLRNPVTGGMNNLELDCYDEDLRLAVEYSGIQHYKYIPFFHRNKEAFLNQKYRDDMKRRICGDNGITLIEVPYSVKTKNIESYLTDRLREFKFLR